MIKIVGISVDNDFSTVVLGFNALDFGVDLLFNKINILKLYYRHKDN